MVRKPIANPVDPHLQDPVEEESISEIRENLDHPERQEGVERAERWKDSRENGEVY